MHASRQGRAQQQQGVRYYFFIHVELSHRVGRDERMRTPTSFVSSIRRAVEPSLLGFAPNLRATPALQAAAIWI